MPRNLQFKSSAEHAGKVKGGYKPLIRTPKYTPSSRVQKAQIPAPASSSSVLKPKRRRLFASPSTNPYARENEQKGTRFNERKNDPNNPHPVRDPLTVLPPKPSKGQRNRMKYPRSDIIGKMPLRLLCVGPTGSGKTNLTSHLMEYYAKQANRIYVWSPTAEDDPSFDQRGWKPNHMFHVPEGTSKDDVANTVSVLHKACYLAVKSKGSGAPSGGSGDGHRVPDMVHQKWKSTSRLNSVTPPAKLVRLHGYDQARILMYNRAVMNAFPRNGVGTLEESDDTAQNDVASIGISPENAPVGGHTIFLFDDLAHLHTLWNDPRMTSLLFKSRHALVTVIVNVQKNTAVSRPSRMNFSHYAIFNLNCASEDERVIDEHRHSAFTTRESFRRMMNYANGQRFHFLWINKARQHEDYQFMKDFTEALPASRFNAMEDAARRNGKGNTPIERRQQFLKRHYHEVDVSS